MAPNGTAVEVCPMRSRGKGRDRRQKPKKNGDRRMTAQPAPIHIPADGDGAAWLYRVGPCPVCLNAGIFGWSETADGPVLLRYCECSIGTETLAITLDVFSISILERQTVSAPAVTT
jgi:hypothetical protein